MTRMFAVLSVALLAMALSGCGGGAVGSKEADSYLDTLEKTVSQWENKVKSNAYTLYDFGEINKANVTVVGEGRRLAATGQFSSAQQARFADLSARFSKVLMQMVVKPSA